MNLPEPFEGYFWRIDSWLEDVFIVKWRLSLMRVVKKRKILGDKTETVESVVVRSVPLPEEYFETWAHATLDKLCL